MEGSTSILAGTGLGLATAAIALLAHFEIRAHVIAALTLIAVAFGATWWPPEPAPSVLAEASDHSRREASIAVHQPPPSETPAHGDSSGPL